MRVGEIGKEIGGRELVLCIQGLTNRFESSAMKNVLHKNDVLLYRSG